MQEADRASREPAKRGYIALGALNDGSDRDTESHISQLARELMANGLPRKIEAREPHKRGVKLPGATYRKELARLIWQRSGRVGTRLDFRKEYSSPNRDLIAFGV